MTSPYSGNFIKGVGGNVLQSGLDLVITVNGNPVYITGVLYKRQSFGRKKVLQIEQTGSRGNPEKDQITLEMKQPDGTPMEAGKYAIKTYSYFTGKGGNSWYDKFEVV